MTRKPLLSFNVFFPGGLRLLAVLLAWSMPLSSVHADAVSDAKARVDAASSDLERVNALYQYAQALSGLNATSEELGKAREALRRSLVLIAGIEAAGDRVQPQSHFHYLAGRVAMRLGDHGSAIRSFNDAERHDFVRDNASSSHKGALLFSVRGEAKWRMHNYAGAVADFDRALKINETKGYYSQRARLHFEMGDAEAARADWARGDGIANGEQSVVKDVARRRALLDGRSTQAVDEFPFDAALLPLNRAIAESARPAEPLLERAAYLVRRGAGGDGGAKAEITKALRDIDDVLRLEPESPRALHLRAQALWRMAVVSDELHDAKTDEAIVAAFDRAMRSAPLQVTLRLEVGDYFVARAELTRPRPLAPPERAKALENAIYNYSQFIFLEPQNMLARAKRIRAEQLSERPDVHLVLRDGRAIAEGGLVADERADAAEVETLQRQVDVAQIQALLQSGGWTEAETALQRAVQKYPNEALLLQARGQLHVLRGRWDDAIQDLQFVLETSRHHAPSWWWLGLALEGKGHTEQAKQALAHATKIDARLVPLTVGTRYAADDPTDAPIVMPPVAGDMRPAGTALQHKEAGNALKAKNDARGALAEYSIALQIDADFADALNNRALIYAEQGKFDLALADISRALELEPQHRLASLVRSDIRATLGYTELALEDANNAVRYADTDARRCSALLSRARLHRRLENNPSAVADLDEAEKLAAGDPERLEQIGELRAALTGRE